MRRISKSKKLIKILDKQETTMPTVQQVPPSDPNMLNAADYITRYDDLDDLYLQVTDDSQDEDDIDIDSRGDDSGYWGQYGDERGDPVDFYNGNNEMNIAPGPGSQMNKRSTKNSKVRGSDMYWQNHVDVDANLLADQQQQQGQVQTQRASRRRSDAQQRNEVVSRSTRNPAGTRTSSKNANAENARNNVRHMVFYHHHYRAGEDIVLPPDAGEKGEHFHHVHFDGPTAAVPTTMRDKATVRSRRSERPLV